MRPVPITLALLLSALRCHAFLTSPMRRPGSARALQHSASWLVAHAAAETEQDSTNEPYEWALLFDCDGVIVETEELHRLAYNGAFEAFGLEIDGEPVNWSVAYYDVLQNTVGGGKPKMRFHFTETAKQWPVCTKQSREAPLTEEEQIKLIDDLQDKKTEIYKTLVDEIAKPREGVLELMDAAIARKGMAVGICSAATKEGFVKVVNSVVGPERLAKLDVVIAGDDVTAKKPDPMIYNTASERLGVPASKCVVVEDSLVGLRAAKSAAMKCIITYTSSTESEDFYGEGCDAKVPNLGVGVTLDAIFAPLEIDGDTAEILETVRDPKPVPSGEPAAVTGTTETSGTQSEDQIAKTKALLMK